MTKVVYINMHCNGFILETLSHVLSHNRLPHRHRYLVQCIINHPDIEVYNLVTDDGTSMPDRPYLKKFARKNRMHEAEYILKKNGCEPCICVTDIHDIGLKDKDVVIVYPMNPLCTIKREKGIKGIWIADMTHFYGDQYTSLMLRESGIEYYFGEIDLWKYSGLFRKNYCWLKDGYLSRPFSFGNRFYSYIPFERRIKKICATGNIAELSVDNKKHIDFMRFYHTRVMQPRRKMIYENSHRLNDIVECYICNSEENTKRLHSNSQADPTFLRELRWWKNYRSGFWASDYYRKIDMVELYNKYQLVINPEDANGIYAIGAIEAMACGCALIGINSGIYEDLGMRNGIHYISYDGSIGDFEDKARYYLTDSNTDKLEKIANDGLDYVRHFFSEDVISDRYRESILNVSELGRRVRSI